MAAIIAFVGRLDRLATAYRKYLRFDHPFFTALASQIIAALAGAAMVFWGVRLIRLIVWGA